MKGIEQIVVTGGKGGTGKSTFAILKANELRRKGKVVLCDCDIECPNDYLLLGQKLDKEEKGIFASFPELVREKCQKCGVCIESCREHAVIQPSGGYPMFVKELCSGCGACWIACPHQAIRAKKEKVGSIFVNEIDDGFWLVTGQARPGVEETGPLVLETKRFALGFAKEKGADIVLLDTAPGIHCPVISALLGSDIAFVVTEPTPMGAHDLDLILKLCQKLKIPFKVVLNQSDLGNKDHVLKVVKDFGAGIEKEIPYSGEIAELYSQGRLLEAKL